MSKYYKADDVIKCVAQYIMTDAKIDNSYVCGDIEDYIEFTEAILADLPTIDIVECKGCVKHKTHKCHMAFDLVATEDKDFCSAGERIDNE